MSFEETAKSIAEDEDLYNDYVKTFVRMGKACIKDSNDLF